MADSAASAPDHPDRGGHSLYRIGVRRLAALRRRRLERIGPVPVHGRGLVRAPSSRRRKGRPGNQIAAFYTDLATYVAWYHSPATNRHIPDDMPLGEFVFVMHHGGRGGPVLFKDTARDLYRKHVTDDTRLLTAAHPSPCPGALVLDAEAYTGYPVAGDSAGCIKMGPDGMAYIDYILEPLLSRAERRGIVERDPDGAFRLLGE